MYSTTIVNVKTKTTIELQKFTRNRLASLGKKDQTFDKLVDEILNHIEMCDRWWCDNR